MFNSYRESAGCYGDQNIPTYSQGVVDNAKVGASAGAPIPSWGVHPSGSHTTAHIPHNATHATHSTHPNYHSAFHAGNSPVDAYSNYNLSQITSKEDDATPGKERIRSSAGNASAANTWPNNRTRYPSTGGGSGAFLPYPAQLGHFDGQLLDPTHVAHSQTHSRKTVWVPSGPSDNAYSQLVGPSYQRDMPMGYTDASRSDMPSSIIRHTSVSGIELSQRGAPTQHQPQQMHQQQPIPPSQQHSQHHELFSQLVQKEREAHRLPAYQETVRHSVVRSHIPSYHEQLYSQHSHQQFCNSQEVLRKGPPPAGMGENEHRSAFTARQRSGYGQNWSKGSIPYLPFHPPHMLPPHRGPSSAFQPCNKLDPEMFPPEGMMWSKPGQTDHHAHSHLQVHTGQNAWLQQDAAHLFTSQQPNKRCNAGTGLPSNMLNMDPGQGEHSGSSVSGSIRSGNGIPMTYQSSLSHQQQRVQHIMQMHPHMHHHQQQQLHQQKQHQLQQHMMHQRSPHSNQQASPVMSGHSAHPNIQSPQLSSPCTPQHSEQQIIQNVSEEQTINSMSNSSVQKTCPDIRQFLATWNEDTDLATPRPACVNDNDSGDAEESSEVVTTDTGEAASLVVLDCRSLPREEAANLLNMYPSVQINGVRGPDGLLTCSSESFYSSSSDTVAMETQGVLQNLLESGCDSGSSSSSTSMSTPITSPGGSNSARSLDLLLNSALPTPPASQEQHLPLHTSLPLSTPVVNIIGMSNTNLSEDTEPVCEPHIDSSEFDLLSPSSPAISAVVQEDSQLVSNILEKTITSAVDESSSLATCPVKTVPQEVPSVIRTNDNQIQNYCGVNLPIGTADRREVSVILSPGLSRKQPPDTVPFQREASFSGRGPLMERCDVVPSPALSDTSTDGKKTSSLRAFRKRKHVSPNRTNEMLDSLDSHSHDASEAVAKHARMSPGTLDINPLSSQMSQSVLSPVDRSNWAFAQISESNEEVKECASTKTVNVTDFLKTGQSWELADMLDSAASIVGKSETLCQTTSGGESGPPPGDAVTPPHVLLTSKDTQTDDCHQYVALEGESRDSTINTLGVVRSTSNELENVKPVCTVKDSEVWHSCNTRENVQSVEASLDGNCGDTVQNANARHDCSTGDTIRNAETSHDCNTGEIVKSAEASYDGNHEEDLPNTEANCDRSTEGNVLNAEASCDSSTEGYVSEAVASYMGGIENKDSASCDWSTGEIVKNEVGSQHCNSVEIESIASDQNHSGVNSRSMKDETISSLHKDKAAEGQMHCLTQLEGIDQKDYSEKQIGQERLESHLRVDRVIRPDKDICSSILHEGGSTQDIPHCAHTGSGPQYLSRIVNSSPGKLPKILLSRLRDARAKSKRKNGIVRRLPSLKIMRVNSPCGNGGDPEYICSGSSSDEISRPITPVEDSDALRPSDEKSDSVEETHNASSGRREEMETVDTAMNESPKTVTCSENVDLLPLMSPDGPSLKQGILSPVREQSIEYEEPDAGHLLSVPRDLSERTSKCDSELESISCAPQCPTQNCDATAPELDSERRRSTEPEVCSQLVERRCSTEPEVCTQLVELDIHESKNEGIDLALCVGAQEESTNVIRNSLTSDLMLQSSDQHHQSDSGDHQDMATMDQGNTSFKQDNFSDTPKSSMSPCTSESGVHSENNLSLKTTSEEAGKTNKSEDTVGMEENFLAQELFNSGHDSLETPNINNSAAMLNSRAEEQLCSVGNNTVTLNEIDVDKPMSMDIAVGGLPMVNCNSQSADTYFKPNHLMNPDTVSFLETDTPQSKQNQNTFIENATCNMSIGQESKQKELISSENVTVDVAASDPQASPRGKPPDPDLHTIASEPRPKEEQTVSVFTSGSNEGSLSQEENVNGDVAQNVAIDPPPQDTQCKKILDISRTGICDLRDSSQDVNELDEAVCDSNSESSGDVAQNVSIDPPPEDTLCKKSLDISRTGISDLRDSSQDVNELDEAVCNSESSGDVLENISIDPPPQGTLCDNFVDISRTRISDLRDSSQDVNELDEAVCDSVSSGDVLENILIDPPPQGTLYDNFVDICRTGISDLKDSSQDMNEPDEAVWDSESSGGNAKSEDVSPCVQIAKRCLNATDLDVQDNTSSSECMGEAKVSDHSDEAGNRNRNEAAHSGSTPLAESPKSETSTSEEAFFSQVKNKNEGNQLEQSTLSQSADATGKNTQTVPLEDSRFQQKIYLENVIHEDDSIPSDSLQPFSGVNAYDIDCKTPTPCVEGSHTSELPPDELANGGLDTSVDSTQIPPVSCDPCLSDNASVLNSSSSFSSPQCSTTDNHNLSNLPQPNINESAVPHSKDLSKDKVSDEELLHISHELGKSESVSVSNEVTQDSQELATLNVSGETCSHMESLHPCNTKTPEVGELFKRDETCLKRSEVLISEVPQQIRTHQKLDSTISSSSKQEHDSATTMSEVEEPSAPGESKEAKYLNDCNGEQPDAAEVDYLPCTDLPSLENSVEVLNVEIVSPKQQDEQISDNYNLSPKGQMESKSTNSPNSTLGPGTSHRVEMDPAYFPHHSVIQDTQKEEFTHHSMEGLLTSLVSHIGNLSPSDEAKAFPDPRLPNFDVSCIPLPDECEAIKAHFRYTRMKRGFLKRKRENTGSENDLHLDKDYMCKSFRTGGEQELLQSSRWCPSAEEVPCLSEENPPFLTVKDDQQETLLGVVEEVSKFIDNDTLSLVHDCSVKDEAPVDMISRDDKIPVCSEPTSSPVKKVMEEVNSELVSSQFSSDEDGNTADGIGFSGYEDDRSPVQADKLTADMSQKVEDLHDTNVECIEKNSNLNPEKCIIIATPAEDDGYLKTDISPSEVCSELHILNETSVSSQDLQNCPARISSSPNKHNGRSPFNEDRDVSHSEPNPLFHKTGSSHSNNASNVYGCEENVLVPRKSAECTAESFSTVHLAIGKSVMRNTQNLYSASQCPTDLGEACETNTDENESGFQVAPVKEISSEQSLTDDDDMHRYFKSNNRVEPNSVEDDLPPLDAPGLEAATLTPDSDSDREMPCLEPMLESAIDEPLLNQRETVPCRLDSVADFNPKPEMTSQTDSDAELCSEPERGSEIDCDTEYGVDSEMNCLVDCGAQLNFETEMGRQIYCDVDPVLDTNSQTHCNSVFNPEPKLNSQISEMSVGTTSNLESTPQSGLANFPIYPRSLTAPRKEMRPRTLQEDDSDTSDSDTSCSLKSCQHCSNSDEDSNTEEKAPKTCISERRRSRDSFDSPIPSKKIRKRRVFSTTTATSSSSSGDESIHLSSSTSQNALDVRERLNAGQENISEIPDGVEQGLRDSASITNEEHGGQMEQMSYGTSPGISQIEISDIRTVEATDSLYSPANASSFNLSGFLETGWSFDMNSPRVTCSSEVLSVDSMYNWPYVEEEVLSESCSTPSQDWSDLGRSGQLQVKCKLGWDRILMEGNGLILGPAKIHVQVPGQPPQQEADLRWNVITRRRQRHSSCLEENNNTVPGSKNPIVMVKTIVLKRPVSSPASCSHLDSAAELDNSATGQFVKTKGALKCFQDPSESGEPRKRKRSLDQSKSPASVADSDVSCAEVPKVIIKRTGTGTCYKSFLQSTGLQPVVILDRNPRIDAMAQQLVGRHKRKRSAELKMQAWKIREDKQNTFPLQMLAGQEEKKPEEGAVHSQTKSGQNGKAGTLLKVVELLSQWRREEEQKAASGESTPVPHSILDCPDNANELSLKPDSRHYEKTYQEDGLGDSSAASNIEPIVDPLFCDTSIGLEDDPSVSENYSFCWDSMETSQDCISNSPENATPVSTEHWSNSEIPLLSPCMFVTGDGTAQENDDNTVHRCHVCGRELVGYQERISHIKQHPYRCQDCLLAFPLQSDFAQHLSATHMNLRERHHCLLCQRSFSSQQRYSDHVKSSSHCHMERSQRRTIHTLFQMFTGANCPRLDPITAADFQALDWSPTQSSSVHFYHEATPLQLATQAWYRIQRRKHTRLQSSHKSSK